MAFGAYTLVEVVGRSNGIRALDAMCKTASVEYVTDNTRNGGHETMIVGGDVSACKAALDTIRTNPPCKIISSGIVVGPSDEFNHLMEEWKAGRK